MWYNIKFLIKVEKQRKEIVLLTYKETTSVSQESYKNCKNRRIREEVENTRILYRRNGKRILSDNQEKQESGKSDEGEGVRVSFEAIYLK